MERTTATKHFILLCLSNYPLKIIRSYNLVITFCDLYSHLFMSPDCLVSHMKEETKVEVIEEDWLNDAVKETFK